MIFEAILTLIFALARFLIGFIPSTISTRSGGFDLSGIVNFLSGFFAFYPMDLFFTVLANVVFWLVFRMWWAVIVWAYNKIPGIN